MEKITLQRVWQARKRISSITKNTPLMYSPELSEIANSKVYLKLENLNTTTSFKIRGATNKILCLSDEAKEKGITTFSTGNFGRSVAYVANKRGIRAVICISNRVPKAKVEALQATGAEVEIVGQSQDEAEKHSYQLQQEKGMTVIHPFDDPKVIAGQGTIALEILDELPEVDTVLAGLSGGGLLSGLGTVFKQTNKEMKLYGLSTANGAAMYESIRAGKPIQIKEKDTLADSLLGGIGIHNQYTFELVQRYVDDIFLLNELELKDGMKFMLKHHRMIIEGAAASGIGAILNRRVSLGNHVVVVISGCSVDPNVVIELMKDS